MHTNFTAAKRPQGNPINLTCAGRGLLVLWRMIPLRKTVHGVGKLIALRSPRLRRLSRLLFGLLLGASQAWSEPVPLHGRPAAELASTLLRAGDQSGMTQALLAASGEDRELPYQLRWHPFAAGPALMEALNAGAIDIGVVGNAPPVFAQAGGFEVRIVAAAEGAQNNNALLLPAGSGIRTSADLKGKRIAVAKGSSAHYLLLAALSEAGLTMADTRVSYVSPVDAQNAFASGHLDAWAVWYPFVGQATSRGAQRLLDGSRWPETGLNFTVASQAALNDPLRAELIGDLIQRLARAQAWATANPEPWAEHLAGVTRLPLALVREMLAHQQLRYVPLDDRVGGLQQRLADAFYQARLIPRPLHALESFDQRYNSLLPENH
ncbi:sulfonate transport system substrate-binding protein [Pseudomonas flavescens]|uniref:Putative aliphatic sulfonates-binding protein n=1 Tax=Phytopseudomonas flavescens TaxID=29435 RepID=A0A1G8EG86_9GAMM|nr:ABC transporter substrate-binding protein [Pseudomonas flavescens]SDH68871.1 sulfonate transport system substrate-binding protein [Pseudomonas flavescens]